MNSLGTDVIYISKCVEKIDYYAQIGNPALQRRHLLSILFVRNVHPPMILNSLPSRQLSFHGLYLYSRAIACQNLVDRHLILCRGRQCFTHDLTDINEVLQLCCRNLRFSCTTSLVTFSCSSWWQQHRAHADNFVLVSFITASRSITALDAIHISTKHWCEVSVGFNRFEAAGIVGYRSGNKHASKWCLQWLRAHYLPNKATPWSKYAHTQDC